MNEMMKEINHNARWGIQQRASVPVQDQNQCKQAPEETAYTGTKENAFINYAYTYT